MAHIKRTDRTARYLQKGFTVTELMVAVSIIGVLAAVGMAGFLAQRPTRNFHADSRDLVSNIQRARIEAVSRGTCVGIVFLPVVAPAAGGGYTGFVDDGAGGGVACNAVQDGTENAPGNILFTVTVKPFVALTAAGAATAADPNQADLFSALSFNQRALVATRLTAGAFVLKNNAIPANATLWSRVVVFQSGGALLQTNNNPANEANWD